VIITASDTQITCTTGAHVVGTVEAVVERSVESGNLTGAFTYVSPEFIALTISDTDVVIDGAPNALYTDHLTMNVKTNRTNGYHLDIESSQPNLKCATSNDYINAVSGTSATLNDTWGYQVDADSDPATVPTTWNWVGVTTAPAAFITAPTATDLAAGEDTVLWFGTRFDYAIPSCNYSGSVVITAVGNGE
jgi:hypothetical protein